MRYKNFYFDEANRLFIYVIEGNGRMAGSFLAKAMDMKGEVSISMWRDPIEYCVKQAVDWYKEGYRGSLGVGESINDDGNSDLKEEFKKFINSILNTSSYPTYHPVSYETINQGEEKKEHHYEAQNNNGKHQ